MTDLCANCQKRPATMNWVGSGSTMDFIHGNYTRWCDYCATEAQLAYARERAADIQSLEAKLADLKSRESS